MEPTTWQSEKAFRMWWMWTESLESFGNRWKNNTETETKKCKVHDNATEWLPDSFSCYVFVLEGLKLQTDKTKHRRYRINKFKIEVMVLPADSEEVITSCSNDNIQSLQLVSAAEQLRRRLPSLEHTASQSKKNNVSPLSPASVNGADSYFCARLTYLFSCRLKIG